MKARATAVLEDGFGSVKVKIDELWENSANYYVINYWPEDEYNNGHVPGAIQYTPKKTFHSTASLNTLPTDKPIVVYCYTGQHSAFIAAYLRILGYDARTLLFGANSFQNENLVKAKKHGFTKKDTHDYEIEESEAPVEGATTEEGGC